MDLLPSEVIAAEDCSKERKRNGKISERFQILF
jgi:hypothetical protein